MANKVHTVVVSDNVVSQKHDKSQYDSIYSNAE